MSAGARLIRGARRLARAAVVLGLLAVAALVAWGMLRGHPQDLPWTPLDLGEPIGAFTGRKLTALGDDAGACRALLDRAGVRLSLIHI